MTQPRLPRVLVLCLLAAATWFVAAGAEPRDAPFEGPPLGFVLNRGQLDAPARYYALGPGGAAYFEPHGVTLDRAPREAGRPGVAVRIDFPAARAPRLGARGLRETRTHVLGGSDPRRWRAGLPSYDEVQYLGIAPGADLVYRIDGGRLKYDVVMADGADLALVRLRYRGVDALSLDPEGGLILHTPAGALREEPPYLYQEVQGVRRAVEGGYRLLPGNQIGFWASGHDPALGLVVDPGVVWSTFLGGSGVDNVHGMVTDANGDVYIVGSSASADFPTTSGAYQRTAMTPQDVVVSKLRGDGATVLWSTYLAGTGNDEGRAVALDASGNVYVTGHTGSTDFPVTAGAHRTQHAGGIADGFVAKLAAAGNVLLYGTYVGGNWDDYPRAIAVDGSGNAVIAGSTNSLDFPVTQGVVKPVRNPSMVDGADGFLTKLNANGSGLLWSTYFGSDGGTDNIFALALDGSGRPTVAGWTLSPTFPTTSGAYSRTFTNGREGYVTRLTATVSGYVYSTFVGADGNDECLGLVLDSSGAAYVAGRTTSTGFPTTPGAPQRTYGGGAYDAFALKLNPAGDALAYATFLGGSGSDEGRGITVTSQGVATVTGSTDSNNYPVTAGAYDLTANGGSDAFVTCLSGPGGLAYSTYLGGSGADVGMCAAMKPNGHAVIAGQTGSSGFPTTAGAYDRSYGGSNDDFVATIDFGSGTVEVPPGPPTEAALGIHPNPAPDRVTIRFSLERPGRVVLTIRDLQGRVVRTVEDRELLPGAVALVWDGRNSAGAEAPAGLYFVHLVAAGKILSQRLARAR